MGTLFDFNASFDKFEAAITTMTEDLVRQVALALHRGILEKTPVKSGFARDNWQITFGAPASETRPIGDYSSDIALLTGPLDMKAKIFISNCCVYITSLEYGHSGQAPQGMVRVTIEEVKDAVGRIQAALQQHMRSS